MSLPRLTIIPAGAGSGKTYSIQKQLGQWVTDGKVAPERIVAVTFTEAAAAELRERIGAELLKLGRVEDALRLDEAYISTIHGFGLRILTEFAFESGSSPRPRLLNEDEQSALVRLAVARTDHADEVTSNLAAYGYVYDFNSKRSPEDGFRNDLLAIVELLRSVGWREYSDALARKTFRFSIVYLSLLFAALLLDQRRQQGRCGVQQRQPGRRQAHGGAPGLDQRHAGPGLQRADAAPEGRVRDVALGGLLHVAAPAVQGLQVGAGEIRWRLVRAEYNGQVPEGDFQFIRKPPGEIKVQVSRPRVEF